jgi:zinc/manganese transport system substrate-binding protein
MKWFLKGIVLALSALAVGTAAAQDAPLRVVATTTIVADVARQIGGDLVTVTALVPVDSDAHAFEPAPQDVQGVADAQLVLAVGAGYEAFLGGLMDNAAAVPLVIVNTGVEMYGFSDGHADDPHADEPLGVLGEAGVCEAVPAADDHAHGSCDPHTWTDPRNVMLWADTIAAALTAVDPANADTYTANAAAYQAVLQDAFDGMTETLSVVPAERRRLVTNHEFMSYFARAFDFEVAGVVIPGGTTGGENDPQMVAGLIDHIRALGVSVIFAEASASTQVIDMLAQDAGVNVVTTLSESLTAPDGIAPTYLDYLRVNAQTIADALREG